MVTCEMFLDDGCPRAGVLYSCLEPSGSGTYYTRQPFFDTLTSEIRSCTDDGGTWTTTPPPAPIGAPCGCRRSSALCQSAYGDACSTLTCAGPMRLDSACPSASGTVGRCMSFDGQNERVFYGVSEAEALRACYVEGGPYYWVP